MPCRMPGSDRQAVRVDAPSASGWVSQRRGSTRVRLKKFIEGIRVELIERLHNHISLQMITVVSYADATHACAPCPLDSGSSIFHDNATSGQGSHPRSSYQIHFRIRFAAVDIFSGDDALENVAGRQSLKYRIDVRARRG
jgi:hypothetical protein